VFRYSEKPCNLADEYICCWGTVYRHQLNDGISFLRNIDTSMCHVQEYRSSLNLRIFYKMEGIQCGIDIEHLVDFTLMCSLQNVRDGCYRWWRIGEYFNI
jgi:hypothetical protein